MKDLSTVKNYRAEAVIPGNAKEGVWVGRVWIPKNLAANGLAGPRVVLVRNSQVFDLSDHFSTMAELISSKNPAARIGAMADLPPLLALDAFLAQSLFGERSASLEAEKKIVLLAPNDLQAIKACGVTFVKSLLERVVEEKAKGNPVQATKVRQIIMDLLGDDLSKVKPGSPETVALKARLIEEGMWSQYLEVGIGPDAEVFTKSQPLSAVSYGAQIGVLPSSHWNNPEPEIVLAISNRGEIVGATLGNDVNLRDYEGRSALLLGEAKDQNGSCSIGPLIRLFDGTFSLKDVKNCEVTLSIEGEDGFQVKGSNRMAEISRSPESLAEGAINDHHQYPDGLVLFLGTMFAPTGDRGTSGSGFTHKIGDRVEISTPHLGRLVNWVNHTNRIPRWDYGISKLVDYLIAGAAKKSK
jgi:fumarylacetoacetate (FAA) hydrolase family protein